MKRYLVLTIVFTLAMAMISLSLGCEEEKIEEVDEAEEVDETSLLREDSDGGIDSRVNWENPGEELPEFTIGLDTHAGDLTRYDLAELSNLTTDMGEEFSLEWEFTMESLHHPEGVLTAVDGSFSPEAEQLVLQIEDLDGAFLEFEWNLESLEVADLDADESTNENEASRLAVANAVSGSVSILDIDNYKNIANHTLVDNQLSHGIAVDEERGLVYAGGLDEEELIIFDYEEEEVKERVKIDARVHGVDLTLERDYVLISSAALEEDDEYDVVTVVDTDNFEISERLDEYPWQSPAHINIDPLGRYLYVANVMSDNVAVLDADNFELVEMVSVGEMPNEVVSSYNGDYIFSANVESSDITVIETKTWEVKDTIPAGEGTHGIAVTPDDEEIWTANRDSNTVSIIDFNKGERVKDIDLENYANHITFSANGEKAFVTREDDVAVIDVSNREMIDTIPVEKEPHEMAVLDTKI